MPVPKHKLFMVMEDTTVSGIIKPSINSEAKYWMMRTMGGDYFQEFVEDGFIAMGYNDITLKDLQGLPENDNISKETLASKLKNRNVNITNTNYPASQILKFYREMKVGDFVVVPGKSSHYVSFGIIKQGNRTKFSYNL